MSVKFRSLAIFAVLASGLALSGAAAPATSWSNAAPLPQARNEMQAVTVGNKIYLLGGAWTETKDGMDIERYTEGFTTEFDPAANVFREHAKEPEGLTHQGIAVLNGKIYLAGGFAGGRHTMPSANVYAYDIAADKWTKLAPLSSARGAVALAVFGGKIHAFGGRTVEADGGLNTHEIYDPATNSWKAASPLPQARDHVGISVVGNLIHIYGGRINDANSNVGTHDVYDPAADKWTTAAPVTTPRSSSAFADYKGYLFFAGGECNGGKAYDTVEAFDTKANAWASFPKLPKPLHGFAAASVGDKLYFFGGSTGCGGGNKSADTLVLSMN